MLRLFCSKRLHDFFVLQPHHLLLRVADIDEFAQGHTVFLFLCEQKAQVFLPGQVYLDSVEEGLILES